ncbi:MAG: hypothetical protein JXB15_08625 [Anaerolineales bacterium]|nr:hypothetical protein [Anaerolineales bacterium]
MSEASHPASTSAQQTAETLDSEWLLRRELFLAAHRWPWIILACLLGSLLGWAISYALPSPYRATRELYVGLNVYQAQNDRNVVQYSGIEFVNANDYKNWQMANLNSLIFMDFILDETLEILRRGDSSWEQVSRPDLRAMLHVYWRNAGKWRMVAENQDAQRAAQAVTAWQEVVVTRVNQAIQESKNSLVLDRQLRAVVDAQNQFSTRLAALQQVQTAFQAWESSASQGSAGAPPDENARQQLLQLLNQAGAGGMLPTWRSLLETFPTPASPYADYQAWLNQVMPSINQEIQTLQAQVDVVEIEKNDAAAQYMAASQKSLGLSAELQVDRITQDPPALTIVRPTALLMLVGGFLGLAVWTLLWLGRLALHLPRQNQPSHRFK